jgi:hypothetical protein
MKNPKLSVNSGGCFMGCLAEVWASEVGVQCERKKEAQ